VDTTVIIIFAIAIAIVAAIAYGYWKSQTRDDALRDKFGPEYHRVRSSHAGKSEAMDELRRRERRIEAFRLRDLAPADSDRFDRRWRVVQASFVDTPSGAVSAADASSLRSWSAAATPWKTSSPAPTTSPSPTRSSS
jgi:FtsZ-interacting cell division protein ZipA